MTGPPGRTAVLDGREVLYFGGNSYLGLHGHSDVIAAAVRATQEHGVHTATSPTGYGRSDVHLASERALATYFGAEEAFHFVSGYLAMSVAVATLKGSVGHVLMDGGLHPCGVDALASHRLPRVKIPHFDPGHLKLSLRSLPLNMRVLLAVDGVDSGTGALAPLADYGEILLERPGSVLLVDDAHGVGILGDGRGSVFAAGLGDYCNRGSPREPKDLTVFQVGTASKALGSHGGMICGDRGFMGTVLSMAPQHGGASAPVAAACGALEVALPLADGARRRAATDLANHLRDSLVELEHPSLRLLSAAPDHPLVSFQLHSGDHMARIESELWSRGVALPYLPTYGALRPPGALRCTVTSDHTPADIESLMLHLAELL